jgi:hypothetical protein
VLHLTAEQQLFILYQIRNWLFGRYGAFRLLNEAWSVHGAQAYFWN